MPAAHGNDLGHWESDAIVPFNDRILARLGSEWNDWQEISPDWFRQPAFAGEVAAATSLLADEFEGSSFFVLKDPRICRLVPFWKEAIAGNDIEAKFILPIRNPLEVADSLERRDGMDQRYGIMLWLRHVLDAERHTRGATRMFTSYAHLLNSPEVFLARLANGLALQWPRQSPLVLEELSGFLDHRARHHVRTDDDLYANPWQPKWVRDVAAILSKWAEQGEDEADYPALDRAGDAFNEASLALSSLVFAGRQTQAKVTHSEQQLAAATNEISQIRSEAAESIDATSQEANALRTALEASEREALALRDETQQLHHHIAQLESRLAQRQEEATQAQAALETALKTKESEMLALRNETQQLHHHIAQLESHLAQRQEEAIQAWAALDEARKDAQRAQDATIKETLAAFERERQQANTIADLRTRLHELDIERANSEEAEKNASQKLEERFREIATLTRALQEREHKALLQEEINDWLRRVNIEMSRRPPWWSLMPRDWQRRRFDARLAQRGLFDAQSYLELYPDVAASGMSPLRHYIMHGIAEGRARR